jgi:adsorption protein B
MKIHAVLLAYFFFWNLMILVSIGFLVFAIDDLLIDILYWVRVAKNKKKGLKNKKFTYGSLAEKKEQKIAVMVAAWKEADVIGKMLLHNLSTIDYKRYDVFVGLYPNDKETIDAVLAAKEEYPNIHCVVGELDGPINKAQNLNVIYDYIKKSEINLKEAYDIYVFHDSEDVVHPLSLKIYNAMSPQSDMIQIPVLPLPVKLLSFTHWVYADEFAENHTKDMIVREQIKGLVPSAGVGTAFIVSLSLG